MSDMPSIEQSLLMRVLEQNPASIVITDPDATITYVNPRFCELTGYLFNEVVGQNPRILKADDSQTDYVQMWKTLVAGHQWRGEFYNKKKNGENYWELALITVILDAQGRIINYLAIKEDITERKQIEGELERTVAQAIQLSAELEFQNAEIETQRQELDKAYTDLKVAQSQMLQREKMASIGLLAAGVAHEINNPIGFVSSNLRSLGKYLHKLTEYVAFIESGIKGSPFEEECLQKRRAIKLDYLFEDCTDLIAESVDGTERVSKIVQSLKTFSRVDQAEVKLTDLNECLQSAIAIVWNEIKYKAELEKNLSPLPEILCNPQEITQVFTNILVNAAQAIEKDGKIQITSSADTNTVTVRFEDNGCGIPEQNLERIFEPFFTTKKVGQGTGLGMSISYEVIKKHGGDIRVASRVGEGTVFTMTLPLRRIEKG